jgi:DNA-binding SARP family transcriptional activator
MPSIEIHLLGAFRVAVDGRAVPDDRWRQRKAALLLQRLALEPSHRMHAEQLMEFLWPEGDGEGTRNSLHKTMHAIRGALEPDLRRPADSHFLLTRGPEVILTAPERLWIDAQSFAAAAGAALKSGQPAAMEAAAALYESPLLPADPYEPWIADRREQLQTTFLKLLSELARAHQARGDSDRAIDVLSRILGADPANEPAHQALMRAYAASGRRQLAIRQYRDCCSALRRELDAAPDRSTVELYETIVGGEPAPAARIAVLPFENGARDPELDYVCDGLTDGVIGILSRLPRLQVMAHSTVSRHANADPREAAQALNVKAVVTGKVFQRQDQITVRMEMIQADGSRAWGATYERPLNGMLGLQDEIAGAIAAEAGVTGASRRRYTGDSEAYRLYLRGRHLWNKRTLDSVSRSVGYFQKAIDIDAEYALAWVGLSDAYAKLGDVGVAAMPPIEAFAKAKIAAIRAVEIDSHLAEAHTSLAHLYMHEYQWEEAERQFDSALRWNPNDLVTLQWVSTERLMTGRKEEAFEMIARVLELEPLYLPANTDLADHLYAVGEHEAAVEQYHKALELDSHYLPAQVGLGRTLVELARYDEALAAFEQAKVLGGERPEIWADLACAHARAGGRTAATALLTRLCDAADVQYVSPYSVAAVHAALGDPDQAFTWLGRALEQHAAWTIWVNVDPRVESLRRDARFGEILRQVGLGS